MDGLKHVKPWIIKGRKYPKQGEIIKSFRSCNVTHVSRGGNWVAHMLARRLGAKLWSVVGTWKNVWVLLECVFQVSRVCIKRTSKLYYKSSYRRLEENPFKSVWR